jgi:GNAT superfamily N-acetyltransferase
MAPTPRFPDTKRGIRTMQSEYFADDGPLGPPPDPLLFANSTAEMSDNAISTRPLTKADYDHVVRVIDKWWGGPTSALAHPIYFYEFGEHAMLAESEGHTVGFLLGFIAGHVGYVHLVGIDPEFRRQHVGTRLYQGFERACADAGCQKLKAITTLGNDGSVRFHEALGWLTEEVENYAGPGRTRVVFTKPLGN